MQLYAIYVLTYIFSTLTSILEFCCSDKDFNWVYVNQDLNLNGRAFKKQI